MEDFEFTKIIDGKSLANSFKEDLKLNISNLSAKYGRPCLAVVEVGDCPASRIYVNAKIKACDDIGIKSKVYHFKEDVYLQKIIDCLRECHQDPLIHGLLVQIPLPDHLNLLAIQKAIPSNKDVDGITPYNLGRLFLGDPQFLPCTPLGIIKILEHNVPDLTGKHVVVIGFGMLVGRPLACMLAQYGATVTICHSKTLFLEKHTKEADILIVATGVPHLIKALHVKQDVIVIDVGISRLSSGKIIGDVDFADVSPIASAITPVPGGVGPMTVAMLLSNTFRAFVLQTNCLEEQSFVK